MEGVISEVQVGKRPRELDQNAHSDDMNLDSNHAAVVYEEQQARAERQRKALADRSETAGSRVELTHMGILEEVVLRRTAVARAADGSVMQAQQVLAQRQLAMQTPEEQGCATQRVLHQGVQTVAPDGSSSSTSSSSGSSSSTFPQHSAPMGDNGVLVVSQPGSQPPSQRSRAFNDQVVGRYPPGNSTARMYWSDEFNQEFEEYKNTASEDGRYQIWLQWDGYQRRLARCNLRSYQRFHDDFDRFPERERAEQAAAEAMSAQTALRLQ